ncbi:MAG: prenyltransferase [Sarcina sp.]
MSFFKRIYTVMEVRTGFATGLPVLSAGLFGAYASAELKPVLLILMFISGFSFNIASNVAAEIKGFLKNEDTQEVLTGHKGSEGLARGDASLKDAIIALAISFIIGAVSGLMIVFITKNIDILIIGVISAIAAIAYSLGPKPYSNYPVGEVVSGFFVGGVSSVVSAQIQLGYIDLGVIVYSVITIIMTVFLMSVNNTTDYYKDRGKRLTLPHLIGFRNSIKLIILEAVIMIGSFIVLYFIGDINLYMVLIGLAIFYHSFYLKWYKDYYKVKEHYQAMGRDFGPKPLILIYNFNIVMSVLFLINIY